jgi:uncharacterized protein DUF6950
MRLEGWEGRLVAAIEAARARPYELGAWDCFRFACSCVEALTGVNRWGEFAGRYRSRRESLALIAEHGSTFEAAFDWFFSAQAVDVRAAQRGDIVAYRGPDGEKHLGVVTLDGTQAALLGPEGLAFVPVLTCLCAWRVE